MHEQRAAAGPDLHDINHQLQQRYGVVGAVGGHDVRVAATKQANFFQTEQPFSCLLRFCRLCVCGVRGRVGILSLVCMLFPCAREFFFQQLDQT